MEQAPAVGAFDDADVLVERRLLVDEPFLGLDRPRRHDEQHRDEAGHDEVARTQEKARGRGEQGGDDEERALRSHRGDEDKRGQEDAEERARGGQCVEAAGDRARRRDRRHGERIAKGETIPSRTTAGAQRRRTARKLPTTAPADAVSRPSTVKSRNGFAANGITATQIARRAR